MGNITWQGEGVTVAIDMTEGTAAATINGAGGYDVEAKYEMPAGGGPTLAQVQALTGDASLTIARPDLSRLVRDSIQVRLSISFWRGLAKLDLASLGLDAAPGEFRDFAAQYLRLGNQRLLPARYWKALESKEEQARQRLNLLGFRSPWEGRLVTIAAYKGLREDLERLESETEQVIDRICKERDAYE